MTADTSPDRRELLKNAFGAIEQLKAKVRSLESAGAEPIAIVGAACRFPGGANDLDEYWALLDEGRNVVAEIPAARWERVGHADAPLGWFAGLVDDIDGFDPRFFGISPREATTMDPQQRLVLEVVWEALENAGIAPDGLSGSRTGVFLGITGHDYADLLHDLGGVTDVYAATGNANNAAAGRVSFLLGLQGPSVAIDTACSSSLVAIHLACLAVRAGDCRMALAGGVNALLAPDPFVCFRNWGMMAPDGRCKTFDALADGFVRGEGCGMIVVKRLSDAQADGDRILAVIRGSAVNQDGRSSGLTVPNGPAQEAVIRQALAVGKVDPADVSYVEAHGTGTALGDPIEANALAATLGVGRAADNPLVLGSVKTNIGHLESAAGVAGLLKVVLSLREERIPPHLNFTAMNPDIDWGDTPVEIPVAGRAWKRGEQRRIAGVSSFGFSGTNAHVVLEEAPPVASSAARDERSAHLFTFSAKTEAACDALAQRFVDYLATSADRIADICHSANTGRAHFSERVAIPAKTREELRDALASRRWIRGRASAAGQRVAFLFTGQGSQWRGMGRELYETEPVFRSAMDDCARLLAGKLEHSLIDVIYGQDERYASLLDETAYTQPALFALEWSLAQMWKHWGIEPSVVFGHSVGEYVALTVAGVWSLEDGISIIAERGRLMQRLGAGWGMTAVHCSRAEAESALRDAGGSVSIAAVNGADNLVLAGRLPDLATVQARLDAAGVQTKRLTVSHGFHSAQMDDVADVFAQSVMRVAMNEPRVRIVSSSTGKFIASADELRDASYWRRQVRSAVEFASAMETLSTAGFDTFLEIGPTPTLCSLGRECIGRDGQLWAPSMRRDQNTSTILESLGRLYVRGADVKWTALDGVRHHERAALPSYPFRRQRFWASGARTRHRGQHEDGHPFLGSRFEIAGPTQTFGWQTEVSFDAFPYLADHRVQGGAIVPATAYLEMAVAAGHAVLGAGAMVASDAQFLKPLFLAESTIAQVQVSFEVESKTARIHSRVGGVGGWTLHASFHVVEADAAGPELPPSDVARRASREMTGAEFYAFFAARGNQWGAAFQGVEHAWLGDGEGWASVVAPSQVRDDLAKYYFHPAVGDAAGHILAAIAAPERGAFVGQGIDSVCVYDRPRGARLLACARLTPTDNPLLRRGDVTVFDEDGRLIAKLFGAQLRYLEAHEQQETASDVGEWMYQLAWREAPFVDRAPDVREWMILGSSGTHALAAILAERMRADDAAATVGIDPPSDWLSAILSARSEAIGIVDLRGLDLGESTAGVARVSSGLVALLDVVRATANARDARIWIATRGVHAVGGPSSADGVWQAPLWGIGRTLAVEHSEIHGGMVDLDATVSIEDAASALWRHLRAPGGEDQVVLRGAQRFAARLEHFTAVEEQPLRIRPDGAYLVTGGLGGLGLEIARWLVRLGARHLLLVGRTALPDRSTWDGLELDHPQAAAIQAIRELESSGAVVRTGAVNVADADALSDFLASVGLDGPPVVGVIHTAGILRHALLVDLTDAELRDMLQPKVGVWSVSRALNDSPLEFFVCFSSASALLGSPKLGAYAAGNCFLDAFAHHLRGQGRRAISVDWGMWTEAGMASRFEADAVQLLAGRGMGAMRTEQALDALGRIMRGNSAQVAVLPVNWRRWAELFPAYTSSPMLSAVLPCDHQGGVTAPSSELDAVLALAATDRPARLQDYLARALGRILGFAAGDIDVNLPISVLGLDSLMAVELKNRIASDLRVSLPTIRLLQGPSLAELAAEIEPQLQAERASPSSHAELLRRVDELSDAEVDAALAELLKGGMVS